MSYLLLCHNPNNLISKGIRLITDSKYNHGAILFDGDVYEFNEYGKVVTPYIDWKYKGTVKHVPIHIVNDPRNINGKYDFGIFLNEVLFCLTKNEYFSNRDNPDAWYCFEFCGYVMGMKNSWKLTGKDFESLTN
jgi:hypothetical protein